MDLNNDDQIMLAPEELQSHFRSKRDLYRLLSIDCKSMKCVLCSGLVLAQLFKVSSSLPPQVTIWGKEGIYT